MSERWTLDLPTFLGALKRRWWVVLLLTLITGGAAYGLSTLQPERFESTAELLFGPGDPAPSIDPATPPPDRANAPERTAATNLALASADSVARRVREKLDSPLNADQLRDRVELAPKGQADIVTITASAASRREAARIANAFANEVVALRQKQAQAKVQRVIDAIRQRLAVTPPTDPAAATLRGRADQLEVQKKLQTSDVELAEVAVPPIERRAPKPLRNAGVGGVLGLLLGLLAVVLLQRFDRRVQGEDEAADILGAPAIARIPLTRRGQWQRELFRESFHFLRVYLQLRPDLQRYRTIAVTSALPGDGKSTVVVGLAEALAAGDSRVVVADCDLRRPTLHQVLDTGASPGITDALLESGTTVGSLQKTSLPNVQLLAAGPALPISASVLADSYRLEGMLDELRAVSDYVIVDTSPVTIGADALAVAATVDGVIMVVDTDSANRQVLAAAAEQLRQAGAEVIGVVLNRADVLLADKAYRGYYGAGAYQRSGGPPAAEQSQNGPVQEELPSLAPPLEGAPKGGRAR